MKQFLLLTSLLWAAHALAEVPAHEDRNEAEYNKQYAIALDGYDPVSYFEEGGGVALVGSSDITFTYGTVTYYFTSEAHRDLFKTNPLKYEPSYGSWCAYGMANNAKILIQPTVYTIHGNRAHFFVNKNAKKNFDKDVADHEERADANWKNFSGEEPRL